MYQEPKLEYYGTFRELTQIGVVGPTDNITILGSPGSVGNNFVCVPETVVGGVVVAAHCFST